MQTVEIEGRERPKICSLAGMLADGLEHHRAGRINQAERIYRHILTVDARHADTLHLLGMIEFQRKHHDAAARVIRQAIAIDERQAFYHSNLGTVLQAQGKLDQAAACYERSLALNPDLAEAHLNLGNILRLQGKLDLATACYERTLALKPECAEAFSGLGNTHQSGGNPDRAVACYERALVLNPDFFEAHNNLGTALAAQGRMAEAIPHYERALKLNPGHANAHSNLGIALAAEGRMAEAIVHYERSLQLNPDHGNAHNNLGVALAAQGRMAEATARYRRALELDPRHANAHNNLGIVLMAQDQTDEAVGHYERALAINPDHAEALNNLGNACKVQGRFDEALAYYGRAIAQRPDYAETHFNRSEIKSFRGGDTDLAALERLAAGYDGPASKAVYIHFALAKALEDTGDYIRAFDHLRRGNTLKRRQIDYDERAVLGLIKRTAAVFDGGLLDRFRGVGDPSSIPVFVVGMPRSGSTLIEQILASHPQIHGAGELEHLENAVSMLRGGDPALPYPECLPALDDATLRGLAEAYISRLPRVGALRIVDKSPGNFFRIGLIRLIFPNARIIHTRRHPMDTCVSCFSRLFTSGVSYSYDLRELGRYYRGYTELMAHWRTVLPTNAILDVSYEDVVDDLEGQARRLIDYCGLPWDERCMSFHRTKRTVKTASAVQVRQPLFRGSVQRWRRYEDGLGPLLSELPA